jgi:hypothetical protein
MRSKTAQKILSETPQEIKDRVDEYTTQLLKDKGYIIGIDPYDENSVSESFGAENKDLPGINQQAFKIVFEETWEKQKQNKL